MAASKFLNVHNYAHKQTKLFMPSAYSEILDAELCFFLKEILLNVTI